MDRKVIVEHAYALYEQFNMPLLNMHMPYI